MVAGLYAPRLRGVCQAACTLQCSIDAQSMPRRVGAGAVAVHEACWATAAGVLWLPPCQRRLSGWAAGRVKGLHSPVLLQELYGGRLAAHLSVAGHTLAGVTGATPSAAELPVLLLIDTAGCDMEEQQEEEGDSKVRAGRRFGLGFGLWPVQAGTLCWSAQIDHAGFGTRLGALPASP